MLKTFCKSPLWEAARTLALTAQGLLPAETVIQNVRLVNVCTGEIIPGQDIAVAQGRIALVGDAAHCIGPRTQVLRGEGRYACPGFLDGHIHIESSMLSVGEYARAVLPHGTVGVYIDPHEICNVLGLEGVRCMLRDAARAPLKTMVTIPSCVPAVPGFEDTGGSIGPQEVEDVYKRQILCKTGGRIKNPHADADFAGKTNGVQRPPAPSVPEGQNQVGAADNFLIAPQGRCTAVFRVIRQAFQQRNIFLLRVRPGALIDAFGAAADDLGHAGGEVLPQIPDGQIAGADNGHCHSFHLQKNMKLNKCNTIIQLM